MEEIDNEQSSVWDENSYKYVTLKNRSIEELFEQFNQNIVYDEYDIINRNLFDKIHGQQYKKPKTFMDIATDFVYKDDRKAIITLLVDENMELIEKDYIRIIDMWIRCKGNNETVVWLRNIKNYYIDNFVTKFSQLDEEKQTTFMLKFI